jgi:hypothetical protein
MRKILLHFRFTILFLLVISEVNSQTAGFAYAITDLQKDGMNWVALRKLNMENGEMSDVLINGLDPNLAVYDAVTKKQITSPVIDLKTKVNIQSAFNTGVAAMAYDKKNDRLYFTPMFVDQLRYIDLRTMKLYYLSDQLFTKEGNFQNDEAKIVTRMAVTSDGTGYAITNDGNHFIKFSTGKKTSVTELGPLVDDNSNNNVSIHNRCTSFGGDLVADDNGNLYIISAPDHVFKVDTKTRVAKDLGLIKGLPEGFTTNGAAVDEDGNVIITSAVYATSYFKVNPKNWTVVAAFSSSSGVFKSSDLASGNVINTKSRNSTTEIAAIKAPASNSASSIEVYPNPVRNNNFTLQFNKLSAGKYTIELTDVNGQMITKREIIVGFKGQVENFRLDQSNSKGIYLLKVNDTSGKIISSIKLIVQ